ncbi:V-type ATP synthase subunit F [Streptobacillus moniliformis]|uniref:V-type ATP synthase subunit F n=1 Tax=Streptobacillus moniliformis TaxID=34105 RepID=UPI0007E39630|nr:V-type ATP synthase subunit F [Streptobacillus moniliformis]
MYKIAAIGDRDTVISFKVLGIDVFSIDNFENEEMSIQKIKSTIDYLASNKYGIIFITEEYAKRAEEVLERYKTEVLLMITLIPNNSGSLNLGMSKIDENIEKAIGTNIF